MSCYFFVAEKQLDVDLTWNKVYSVANQWVTNNKYLYTKKNIPEGSWRIQPDYCISLIFQHFLINSLLF